MVADIFGLASIPSERGEYEVCDFWKAFRGKVAHTLASPLSPPKERNTKPVIFVSVPGVR